VHGERHAPGDDQRREHARDQPEHRAREQRGLHEGHREQLAEAQSELAEWSADAVSNAGDDPTDTGAKAYQREHDLALSYNIRDLLAQSERAIGRMDAGTYGVCASCGQAIGKARLQAYPRALLCVTCKQREERR